MCLCQDFLCCIRRTKEFTGQQSVSSLQETMKWGNEDILSINKTDRTCGDMMDLKIIVLLIFWWINCCAFFQTSLILKSFLDICGAHLCTSKPLWSFSSVQFSCSVVSDSLQPMNCSMPGLPVHHKLPEFTQTHIHRVSDAIQPSHPLSSPSPPAPNPSQHQSLFQWVSSSHEVAKVLEFQL